MIWAKWEIPYALYCFSQLQNFHQLFLVLFISLCNSFSIWLSYCYVFSHRIEPWIRDLLPRSRVGKHFFCKGPNSKYVGSARLMVSIATARLCWYSRKAVRDDTMTQMIRTKGQGYVPLVYHFWSLKLSFSSVTNYYSSLDFFPNHSKI